MNSQHAPAQTDQPQVIPEEYANGNGMHTNCNASKNRPVN
jgi:hypothetical protein